MEQFSLQEQKKYVQFAKYIARGIANKLRNHRVPPEDLEGPALHGLTMAMRGWSKTGGASFQTYAWTKIQGYVYDYLREMDILSRDERKEQKRITKVADRLTQSLGRAPSHEEIAEAAGVDVGEVYQHLIIYASGSAPMSLNMRWTTGETEFIENMESPDYTSDTLEAARTLIEEESQNLSARSRKVLEAHLLDGLTLRAAAESIGTKESNACLMVSRFAKRVVGKLMESQKD